MADHQNPIAWETALEIASYIENLLEGSCIKIKIAGSIRRRKPLVNDIEILCIPKKGVEHPQGEQGELFEQEIDLLQKKVDQLLQENILEKRIKKDGTETFGEKVKLLRHKESKIAVDIFITTEENWHNCLVSRTGGKNTNIAIASRAKWKKLNWMLAGPGFYNTKTKEIIKVTSEEEVFHIVGLTYIHPSQRP